MMNPNAKAMTVKFARGLSYLVYFWVIVSMIILVMGFFLKLFGASTDASFVEWTYRNLERVMEPFRGMFPEQAIGETASVLDTSILFAMIVYGMVAIGLRTLIEWLTVRMHRLDAELVELQEAEAAAEQAAPAAQSASPTATSMDAPAATDPPIATDSGPTLGS